MEHFTNIEDFEAKLRNRAEDNVSTLAKSLDCDEFDVSFSLCEFRDFSDEKWVNALAERFGIGKDEVYARLLDVWIEVGDFRSSSPLISKKMLRL